MRDKVIEILVANVVEYEVSLENVADKILSLMGGNELVDSDATVKDGALHDVRESNASRSEPQASVESALGKITETENKFSIPKEIMNILENVTYWESCPDSYKLEIENFMKGS